MGRGLWLSINTVDQPSGYGRAYEWATEQLISTVGLDLQVTRLSEQLNRPVSWGLWVTIRTVEQPGELGLMSDYQRSWKAEWVWVYEWLSEMRKLKFYLHKYAFWIFFYVEECPRHFFPFVLLLTIPLTFTWEKMNIALWVHILKIQTPF